MGRDQRAGTQAHPAARRVSAFRIPRPEWMRHGACRGADPKLFFPKAKASGGPAREICARCDVQPECLDHALADPTLVGIWGGASELERDRMRARVGGRA